MTYIDLSATLPSRRQALRLAGRNNHVGIYDLKRGRLIETGGTGQAPAEMPPAEHRLPKGK